MKRLLTLSRTVALPLLLACGAVAQAQMLGAPVAEVLLGRPLEMTIPARFGSTDAGDECVQADVFYGENRMRAGTVRAIVAGPADQRRIRIESDTPVNEPFVTVSVRAGCRNPITRNYTLLPEYPSEQLLAAADARLALASALPAAPPRLAPKTTVPVARKAAPRPVVVARASRPRLRMEPVELPEQQAFLRTSTTLAAPDGDATRRAAAALLWQAINADPQEVLRTSAMIQQLERDLAQLRQSGEQTRAEMALLRQRVTQPQPWYLSQALVQVLALLVVVAAALAALFWYRTRHLYAARDVWYAPPAVPEPVAAEAAVVPATIEAEARVAKVPAARAAQDDVIAFDLPAAAPVTAAAPAAVARTRDDGMLRVETLAATVEEADFLRSLGLVPDAMDILKAYLQDSKAPAPLAYLELMRLCDEAGDGAAVATVRRRYAQAFGVEAPRLAQFTADAGLDSMPEQSERVTRAWQAGDAMQAIEDLLFLVPTPASPLTLQAGRDLLALYDLAVVRVTEGAATGMGAPLAPWAHSEDIQAATAAAKDAAEAEGGRRFSLDMDLSAPAPAPLETEPVPAQQRTARDEAARRAREEEEAFNEAMAAERAPMSRY